MKPRRDHVLLRKSLVVLGTVTCVVFYYASLLQMHQSKGRVGTDSLAGARAIGSSSGVVFTDTSPGTSQISRWQKYDWMPERKKETFLANYVEHADSPQWTHGERKLTCGNREVDALVAKGVDAVVRHVSRDYINPVDDPKQAVSTFEEALKIDPNCWTARLNLAILRPVVTTNPQEEYKALEKSLREIPKTSPLHAKAVLWTGILLELQEVREKEAHATYEQALEEDPELAMLYFGKPLQQFRDSKKPVSLFRDPRMTKDEGLRIERKAMTKLLLYYEYARHFSGYNHVTREQALAFNDVWFTLVKDLLPPYVLKVLQSCYRDLIRKSILKFDDKQAKRYFHYNSPPVRFLAAVYRAFVTRLFDMEMKTTYTYMGGYPGGSELKPHVDRAQCEVTMSVSIDVNPAEETCPLGLRLEPKRLLKDRSVGSNTKPADLKTQAAYVHPHPGDAFVFRGRGLVHWRDPIPEGMNCTNIFLHYVRKDFVGKQD